MLQAHARDKTIRKVSCKSASSAWAQRIHGISQTSVVTMTALCPLNFKRYHSQHSTTRYVASTRAPHSTISPQPQHRPHFRTCAIPFNPTPTTGSALLLAAKPILRTAPSTFLPGQLGVSSAASLPVFGLGAPQPAASHGNAACVDCGAFEVTW